MKEPLARLETISEPSRLVMQIHGEIDLSNAADLERQIEDALGSAQVVVIDLSHVQFMDSQGVRLVYRLSRRVGNDGVEFSFVAPETSIAGQVLKLTAVSQIVPIRESLSQ
jgi:anti-anti-sigma factor